MRIVYMGTGEIGLPSLEWLIGNEAHCDVVGVFTQPDKKIGRKQILTPPAIKQLAEAHDIPVFQPESLRRAPDDIAALKSLAPDLIIVMAYGQLLPVSVIELPTRACLNLHASLLPRHRGASPIQAAIREGDASTGITLMHVVKALDAGDMVLQETLTIEDQETGGELHDRLGLLGPEVLKKGLPLFENGLHRGTPQDEKEVTYATKLERSDGVIDWTASALEIERLIRAYEPWPGTMTTVSLVGTAQKLKLFPPTECLASAVSATPGTVLESDDTLVIACGDGAIRVSGMVQLEGRKKMPVADLLRGIDLPSGTILG